MKKGWKNWGFSAWRRDHWGLNMLFQHLNDCYRNDGDSLQKDTQWQEAIGTSCFTGEEILHHESNQTWTRLPWEVGKLPETTGLEEPLIISSKVLFSTGAWGRWSPELPSNLGFSIWFHNYQGFVPTRKHKTNKITQSYQKYIIFS